MPDGRRGRGLRGGLGLRQVRALDPAGRAVDDDLRPLALGRAGHPDAHERGEGADALGVGGGTGADVDVRGDPQLADHGRDRRRGRRGAAPRARPARGPAPGRRRAPGPGRRTGRPGRGPRRGWPAPRPGRAGRRRRPRSRRTRPGGGRPASRGRPCRQGRRPGTGGLRASWRRRPRPRRAGRGVAGHARCSDGLGPQGTPGEEGRTGGAYPASAPGVDSTQAVTARHGRTSTAGGGGA